MVKGWPVLPDSALGCRAQGKAGKSERPAPSCMIGGMTQRQTHLIIGAGYLGRRLAALLPGERRRLTRRAARPGVIPLDCNDARSWANLTALENNGGALRIYFCVPPGRIDARLFPDFLRRLGRLGGQRAVLVSSTVVYGRREREVDADSEVSIDSPRAERQYRLERDWLNGMDNTCILRLAGIYGAGRVIGRAGILAGETLQGRADAWLNLIRVDDAATLLKRMGGIAQPARVELGADGSPVRRRDYYTFLAQRLGRPPPGFDQARINGRGRRCDNRKTCRRTGWRPAFPDYRAGLAGLVEACPDK